MTKKQFSFLCHLSLSGVPLSKVKKRFPACDTDPELMESSFQRYFYRCDDLLCLTVDGKRVCEEQATSNFRWRIPFFISVCALILSIISIVLQYFKF